MWLLFFRVLFGSTNLFVFHHPQDYAKQQKDNKTVPAPSYDSAQEEIAKSSGLSKFTSGGKSKGQFYEIVLFSFASPCGSLSSQLLKLIIGNNDSGDKHCFVWLLLCVLVVNVYPVEAQK